MDPAAVRRVHALYRPRVLGPGIGLSSELAGLVVSLTQLGSGLGFALLHARWGWHGLAFGGATFAAAAVVLWLAAQCTATRPRQ